MDCAETTSRSLLAGDAGFPASESESRFQLLMEHSNDVLCELREGRIVYISPNCKQISGLPQEYYLGRSPFELVHPDDRSHVAGFLASGWTGHVTVSFRIQNASGAWRWREANGARVIDAAGRARAVIVLRDVDARRRTEDELVRTEARASALLAGIPDFVFRFSREGRYIDFKAEHDEDLYVPADKIIGRLITDTLPPEVSKPALGLIVRALDEGGIHTLEYGLVKHGELRDYEARFVASGDNEVVVIARDVTERNRAQSGRSVAEERARIAQELHDSVAQFFFGIGIAVNELAVKAPTSPAVLRKRLGHIRKLATQGGREVRSVVEALSSDAAGGDLEGPIERLIGGSAPALRVTYRIDAPVALSHAVVSTLFAGVREALYNARKHASASAVEIGVFVEGDRLVLEAADDGVGDPDSVRRAMDARAGYGLRTLRKNLDAQGGSLSVRGTPGGGVTLRLELPVAAP